MALVTSAKHSCKTRAQNTLDSQPDTIPVFLFKEKSARLVSWASSAWEDMRNTCRNYNSRYTKGTETKYIVLASKTFCLYVFTETSGYKTKQVYVCCSPRCNITVVAMEFPVDSSKKRQ